jgi:hypothetical protein
MMRSPISVVCVARVAAVAAILAAAPPRAAAADAPPSAEDLLKAADRARGAAEEGIAWDAKVDTMDDGNASSVRYLIKVKGKDALAEATDPPRNKGEMLLFNDRNIWFFKPGLKKPVAISARQRLLGQAANGDIASTNYYRDYDGKLVGEDVVDGTPAYRLELKAKAKNVTYDGIRYWISKKDRVGVKGEFLTVGGDVFKTATFEYKNVMKKGAETYPFVSKMRIVSATKPADWTEIDYESPKSAAHPDSIFNVNNLLR